MEAAGIQVVGYVETKLGSAGGYTGWRSDVDVKADIDMWKDVYGVSGGIFLDEGSTIWPSSGFDDSKATAIGKYTDWSDYALTKMSGGRVVVNAGAPFYNDVIDHDDKIIVVEAERSTWDYYASTGTCAKGLGGIFCPWSQKEIGWNAELGDVQTYV